MKNITRRFAPYLFLILLGLGLASHPASAQTVPLPRSVDPVFGFVSADDTDVAMLVGYFSTSATNNSGLVAVAANGDMTFTQGVLGAEAASTEFECPVSGALGGVIDVSDAACNTVGEVCDIINASTSWRCIGLDSMRSDVVDARILTIAATRATAAAGLAINWDTSTKFQATTALTPYRSLSDYIVPGTRTLKADLYTGTRTGLFLGSATSTYGSGTSTLRFYSVDIKQTSPTKWSEVATQIYFTPGGATTVAQTYDFRDIGLWGKIDGKVIARIDNSAAASAITFRTYGLFGRAVPTASGRP